MAGTDWPVYRETSEGLRCKDRGRGPARLTEWHAHGYWGTPDPSESLKAHAAGRQRPPALTDTSHLHMA